MSRIEQSGRMSLRRPKPPIRIGSAPEEEEEEEEEEQQQQQSVTIIFTILYSGCILIVNKFSNSAPIEYLEHTFSILNLIWQKIV